MGLNLEHPWALVCIPLLLVLVWLIDRRYAQNRLPVKRRVTLGARIALIVTLSLAMTAPSVLVKTGAATRWILLDASDSAKDVQTVAQERIRQALSTLPEGQQVGVIVFGKDAMVESPASESPAFSGLHAQVQTQGSDLDAALRLAAALIPSGGTGGVTVMSDGRVELSQSTIDLLSGRGVAVDTLLFGTQQGADAQLSELTVPSEVYEAQSVPVRVLIDANADMDATLVLYQNGQPVATREATLKSGENRFAFSLQAEQTGIVTYEARLVAQGDMQSQNNTAAAYARVQGAPKLLVVQQAGTADALFTAAGMQVDTLRPNQMPDGAEDYLRYDAVVLNNIAYDTAQEKQWQALDAAVRTLGRGLLVLGGDDSYALGGYRGTLMEELLPVRIDVKQKERMPALSLVICIDKSGSMTGGQFGSSRIEVAKEAAMCAAEVLSDRDNIGVIGFDHAAKWVVPFQPATDLAAIQSQIGTLRADGGTAFYSAMDEAFKALATAQTPQKHVIFLSDGQPGDSGFEDVALAMRRAGITLTTVAVGGDADVTLMKLLSTLGGGRSYTVGEFDSVPKIFTKETMMVSGSYVQTHPFTPVIAEPEAFAAFEGLPALDGYQTTTEKPTATVSLLSDTDDPVLCRWKAGAGMVGAWMSDVEGAWSGQWMRWADASRFFGGVLTRLLPSSRQEGTLEAYAQGDVLAIRYTLPDAEGGNAQAAVSMPNGEQVAVQLEETAPGRYEAQLSASLQGAYAIRVAYTSESGESYLREGGAVRGFSGEYDLRNGQNERWTALSASTGGSALAETDSFWDTPVRPAQTRVKLQTLLLLAALLLLLLDIGLRKLPWERVLHNKTADVRAGSTQERKAPKRKQTAHDPKKREREQRQQAAQDTANALLKAKQARKQ